MSEKPPDVLHSNVSPEVSKHNGFDSSLEAQLSPALRKKLEQVKQENGNNKEETASPETEEKKKPKAPRHPRVMAVIQASEGGGVPPVLHKDSVAVHNSTENISVEDRIKQEVHKILPPLEKLPQFSITKLRELIRKLEEKKKNSESFAHGTIRRGASESDKIYARTIQVPACGMALAELKRLVEKKSGELGKAEKPSPNILKKIIHKKEIKNAVPDRKGEERRPLTIEEENRLADELIRNTEHANSITIEEQKPFTAEEAVLGQEDILVNSSLGGNGVPSSHEPQETLAVSPQNHEVQKEPEGKNIVSSPEVQTPSKEDLEEFFKEEEPPRDIEESQNERVNQEEKEAMASHQEWGKEPGEYTLPPSGSYENTPGTQEAPPLREHGPGFISPEHKQIVHKLEDLREELEDREIDYKESGLLGRLPALWRLQKAEKAVRQGEAEQDRMQQQAAEQELENMPREERQGLWYGTKNAGFFLKEWKSNQLAKLCSIGEGDSGFGKFFHALADTYRDDALQARRQIEQSDKTSFSTLKSSGVLAGQLIVLGRSAAELVRLTSGYTFGMPFRYGMVTAQVFSRGALAAKEARLASEAAQNKSRIQDMDEARTEALRIYKQAEKVSGGTLTRKDLEKIYQEQLPDDLIRRLSSQEEFGLSNLAQFFAQETLRDKIELAKKEGKLDTPNMERFLKDCDRMVGQYGAVDMWAFSARTAEMAGKAAMTGIAAESVLLTLKNFFPDIMSQLGKHLESAQADIFTASPHTVPGAASLRADHVSTLGEGAHLETTIPPVTPHAIPSGIPSVAPAVENIIEQTATVDGFAFELPHEALEIGDRGPEGALIAHLMNHGVSDKEKAGWLAHRMFTTFMKTDEAKQMMAEHGIADEKGFLELMRHVKGGGVEVTSGGIHLRDIGFLKAAVSHAVEAPVASVQEHISEPSAPLVSPETELRVTHPEPELESVVNIPGADQNHYEGRAMILEHEGVPKEIISTISHEELENMSPENFENYSSRVETLMATGAPTAEIAHPQDILKYTEDQFHEVVEHAHKVAELKHAGLHEQVIEKIERAGSIKGLTVEEISGGMTVPPGSVELPEATITIHGGRVFVQDRGTFFEVEKYLNPGLKETLAEKGFVNTPPLEGVIKRRARFIYIYEKAIESLTKSGATAANRQQAGMLQKALQQLIARTEKQYGDVFKD